VLVQNKLSSRESPKIVTTSIIGSNGIKTRENSPSKEAAILSSIESARILRSVRSQNTSVDNLDQETIKKMLEVKVVPKIRVKDQKQMKSNWGLKHIQAGRNAPGVEMTMNQ